MKKIFIFIIVTVILIIGCEKDDFCTKEVPKTPKLILRFYDNTNQNVLKKIDNLSVWAVGRDTLDSYKSTRTDSIAIPLNVNTSKTIYHLKMNNIDGNLANNLTNIITIKYTTEDVFISRSCGYKTSFNDITITSNNRWFINFTPVSLTTIKNEFNAHVKVYY